MKFVLDDGGSKAAGYAGATGDCVTRAVAIATGLPYQHVYDAMNAAARSEQTGRRKRSTSNARTGVYMQTIVKVMTALGWKFTPTMGIGTGCKVHLRDGELPMGRLAVSVSRCHCRRCRPLQIKEFSTIFPGGLIFRDRHDGDGEEDV